MWTIFFYDQSPSDDSISIEGCIGWIFVVSVNDYSLSISKPFDTFYYWKLVDTGKSADRDRTPLLTMRYPSFILPRRCSSTKKPHKMLALAKIGAFILVSKVVECTSYNQCIGNKQNLSITLLVWQIWANLKSFDKLYKSIISLSTAVTML